MKATLAALQKSSYQLFDLFAICENFEEEFILAMHDPYPKKLLVFLSDEKAAILAIFRGSSPVKAAD